MHRFSIHPFTALAACALVVSFGACDRAPTEKAAQTSKPATPAAEVPPPAPPPLPTRRLDTTTIGEFFGSRRLLRPYRRDAQEFYAGRGGRLGWFTPQHTPKPQAFKLLGRARKAEADGLDAGRYRIAALERQLATLSADSIAATPDTLDIIRRQRALDLQLTGTYFLLLGDYALGAVNSRVNGAAQWQDRRQYAHLARSLAVTLAARDTSAGTYSFGTRHPEYDRLRRALEGYRALAAKGGWPLVPVLGKGGSLRPGARDSVRVPALRRRLATEAALAAVVRGEIPVEEMRPEAEATAPPVALALAADSGETAAAPLPTAADPAVYDSALLRQVAAFQNRRGLKADGVIGAGTIAALRAPLAPDIRRIRLNMERWRWVPRKKSSRYVLVNIPAFQLHVVGPGGRDELSMRVIVGNKQKSTPIFADVLKYVVLAPYWNVPTSIVVKELRKPQARNPYYLKGEDMEVLRGDKVVAYDKIDWKNLHEGNLAPYRVRQLPGTNNPLGPIKFIFPNDNDVYLHGTPYQALFEKEKRGFSHGCVRVEDPFRLATYLLSDQPEWTSEKLRATIATGKPTWVTLRPQHRLPVYLLYLTAWADADGYLNFRDDIYGHDYTLARALGGELWK